MCVVGAVLVCDFEPQVFSNQFACMDAMNQISTVSRIFRRKAYIRTCTYVCPIFIEYSVHSVCNYLYTVYTTVEPGCNTGVQGNVACVGRWSS